MDEDALTLPELARQRTVILRYDPVTDEVSVDAHGCSPLEVRGIVHAADEIVDSSIPTESGVYYVADPDDEDEDEE